MTPKQTALIKTAKLITIAIAISVLVHLLFAFLTLAQIGIIFYLVLFAFLAKMVYDLELSKAEHEQSLDQLKKDLE